MVYFPGCRDGYAGGPLIDFARRPLQAEYSSYDAEAAAMLVVLTWHLAQPRALLAAVHFDANAVGQAAEGLVAPRDPGEGLGLAGRARCVAQLLEAQGRAPKYSWVKGHAGIVWNEVADRIAKASAIETLPAAVLPEPFGLLSPLVPCRGLGSLPTGLVPFLTLSN